MAVVIGSPVRINNGSMIRYNIFTIVFCDPKKTNLGSAQIEIAAENSEMAIEYSREFYGRENFQLLSVNINSESVFIPMRIFDHKEGVKIK